MTDFVITLLALLAVSAQAALVGVALLLVLAAASFAPASRLLTALRRGLAGLELPLAWLVAAVATSGSLYFSEVAGFIPCHLCWYQRYLMYPLVLLLAVVSFGRLRRFAPLLLPLPLAGLAISSYHHYIERNPAAQPAGCKIGVPCSTRWIWELGYISIPVLAGTAFALISVLLIAAWRGPPAEYAAVPSSPRLQEEL